MFWLCPVRAPGKFAPTVPAPIAGHLGAIGASDADEGSKPPMPLKEQGNRDLLRGARAGGKVCRQSRLAEAVSTWE